MLRVLVTAGVALWIGAGQAAEVSFKEDLVPILKRRCATCHLTGVEPGSMALHPRAAYGSLASVESEQSPLLRVTPGKPADSYLYRKLEGTHLDAEGSGEPMPLDGWPLPDEQIKLFHDWIAAGAPNN